MISITLFEKVFMQKKSTSIIWVIYLLILGKGNDYFKEVFNDSSIIQLLNNELILCYNLYPEGSSFKNFKDIYFLL